MKFFIQILFACFICWSSSAQDSLKYSWKVNSKKIGKGVYELNFSTPGNRKWQLYGPNESISEVPSFEVEFTDSSVILVPPFKETGASRNIINPIFNNSSFKVYEGNATFTPTIRFAETVPSALNGTMRYTFGRGQEFYPLTSFPFSVALEEGESTGARIRINSFDPDHPLNNCGDDSTEGKGLLSIFFLGLAGGFIALLTPCVFPLIPLTVSFFTKRSVSKKKGLLNAFLYGMFIFLIYIMLSIPFHLLDQTNPEILNNISTNVWLNLTFFVVFVVFAISFFGYFEITLPGAFANKADARAGAGNFAGIFFMALTLAIVSFSCTGPILGSLLAGALTNNGGATQLSFGMGGFGLGLALPFALFATFPGWLQSLPKSGGWLTSVKVVLGFLELAMAVKFLSNADLVQQWGFLKREIFIFTWIVIGLLIILYLLGKIRFPHDSRHIDFGKSRISFIILFTAATLYLVPGVTNSRLANLQLISGFPPPLCYSLYENPVNCEKGIEPLRDYEIAIAVAKKQNKPVLIDFTGWACVNCRRMEENVWVDPIVNRLMKNDFVVVSLYVDERKYLPGSQQMNFTTKTGVVKKIITVGDKWATFQSENFNAVSQPQYAIVSPGEIVVTRTKGYTPNSSKFAAWLRCGIDTYHHNKEVP